MKKLFILFFIAYNFSFSQFQIQNEIENHIKYLASDSLEGRKPGEIGNELAAKFIANEFQSFGLKKINNSYFQNFEYVSGVKPESETSLQIKIGSEEKTFILDSNFRPMGFSDDVNINGKLVFVGYGISSSKINYDDYKNLNVKGKIVIALRYSPITNDTTEKKEFKRVESLYNKARIAKEKGAIGIIFLTGPIDDEVPKLLRLRYNNDEGTQSIVAISMKWNDIDEILQSDGKNLRQIQKEINDTKTPNSFEIEDVEVSINVKLKKIKTQTKNVIGILEGNDIDLKNEYIVIGAHFDHLGFGGEGSSSTKPESVGVHNGADDNASGTSGMLALSKIFSETNQNKRSIIFMGFSAEEVGLLGSSYYTKNPLISLDKTIAMINLDMIGRLRGDSLYVYGTGTSSNFDSLVDAINSNYKFTLKKTRDGFGPSDHSSFYAKDIPVLFFFTGLHDDYHNINDDWEKINFNGEEKVLNYVYEIANSIQQNPKPIFTKVITEEKIIGDSRGNKASLGIIPSFGEEIKGAKISGTKPNSSAEIAGLKKDDIIIFFDGKEVNNLMDLTMYLGDKNPNDEVEIVVLRNNGKFAIKAKLGKR